MIIKYRDHVVNLDNCTHWYKNDYVPISDNYEPKYQIYFITAKSDYSVPRFDFDTPEERDAYWDMLDKMTNYLFNFDEKEWNSVEKTSKSD